MSDDSEAKIWRWERYIEECRREAKLLKSRGQFEERALENSAILPTRPSRIFAIYR